mgnify:CR=1 FL=1
MSTFSRLAGALFLTTALTVPSLAHAKGAAPQLTPETPTSPEQAEDPTVPGTDPVEDAQAQEEDVDVSVPGSVIVVTGRRDRNIARRSDQVVSVLSTPAAHSRGDWNGVRLLHVHRDHRGDGRCALGRYSRRRLSSGS